MGAMVYVLPSYEPLRLAEEIAVLDHFTGGRLEVGVGNGVSPYELAYFGVPPVRRGIATVGRSPRWSTRGGPAS